MFPVPDAVESSSSGVNFSNNSNMMDISKKSLVNCPTLLSGMSHEMRTQMNAIVAFSYLLKDSHCNNTEREDFSTQIIKSCDHLIGLFDTFLDSAIIDSGNSKAELKVYRIDTLLDDLLNEFRDILRKDGQNEIELVTENQFSNSAETFIDRNKIFRIIRSLFNNSLKNTRTGYIKIGHYLNDQTVTFYILDSGQGYFKCKEFLHTDDLNQSLSLYNDTYTAINIILAKQLIQMLQGKIWIECNGLTGVGLYFSLPVKLSLTCGRPKYNNSMIAI